MADIRQKARAFLLVAVLDRRTGTGVYSGQPRWAVT